MLKGRRTRKVVAATMLLIFATNTFAPTAAYALTSGPTAPEATSFEPVDTSDMVNLLTGDLTYNIPLFEVPGPEGGYPMALSYHAGIQPDADASWVGLGWTLNPGAISRDVNGYPDDYYNVKQTRRDFWNGGTTTVHQLGVSIGLAGSPASISFGLSIANDTYKGFGIGADVSIGVPVGPLSLQAGAGINPYGGAYAGASASIGLGIPVGTHMAMGAQGGISLSTNFESVDAGVSGGVGISYSHSVKGFTKPLTHQLLGASISSNSTKPSLSVGGITASAGNSKAGNIQTSSSGFGIGIPITPMFGIYLGRKKIRYWSDETLNIYTNGALHMEFADPITGGVNSGFDNHAFDTYHLFDNTNYNIAEHPDPREALGGTFPDNDYYNVTAQGLGGNIRPYAFKEEVYVQNDRFANLLNIKQWVSVTQPHYVNPEDIQYRFVNDFSNRYLQSQQNFAFNSNSIYPVFASTATYGLNDGNYSYSPSNQQLEGSKHIEYIENRDMLPGMQHVNRISFERFYDPMADGFIRRGVTNGGTELENSFNHQIGGYKITNESGVTYHYMLPAYAGSEYAYTRKNGTDATFNMLKKDGWYAYAWYLTGVTGPDYVDANDNFRIDEGDYGYWVSFEYGKWCDDYIWRTPAEGYQSDLDNGFETQAAGKKELYYLNKIKTPTHSAIFEKGLRSDGKGISSTTTNSTYGSYPLYNGGFSGSSKSTLSLNRILLMKNSDANSVSPSIGYLNGHYFHNVFDDQDISSTTSGKALRIISFDYDYSLVPLTPNSYDYASVATKKGKLTLKSLRFGGKGGACGIPPMYFDYDLQGTEVKQATVTSAANNTINNAGVFEIGDILKMTSGGNTYYCTILTKSGSTCSVKYLTSAVPGTGVSLSSSTTKNPPYDKDNHDMWNMYKSDFTSVNLENGENAARYTTLVSSKSVDAWSLRTITSSIGSKIKLEYESDKYNHPVLDQAYKIQLYEYNDLQGGSFWPGGVYYNSHTDNKHWYKIRNLDVFQDYVPNIGDRFNGIFLLRLMTDNGAGGCNQANSITIDSKEITDAYAEIVDLTYYNQYGILGLKLNNVLSGVYPNAPFTGCKNPPDIINLEFSTATAKKNSFGGGLRAKSVAVIDPTDGRFQRTVYDYNTLGSNISSGVTSFEPSVFDDANFKIWNGVNHSFVNSPSTDAERAVYRKKLQYRNMQMLSYTRELPPPGVMYEFATVKNEVYNPEDNVTRQVEGSTTYQFEVFNEKMVGIIQTAMTAKSPYPGDSYPGASLLVSNTLETRHILLRNYTSNVGNLRKAIRYDRNGKKLSETINHYLIDDAEQGSFYTFSQSYETALLNYNNQGVFKENFVNIRGLQATNVSDLGARKAINSMREEYPAILTSQTEIDYITKTKSSTSNIGFDFYSGALTKKLLVDAAGNRFMTEAIPAYKKYPSLGFKVNNNYANKNMLTQLASIYTYKVDNSNTPIGLISASVQTWANDVDVVKPDHTVFKQNNPVYNTVIGSVWRPKKSYRWMPETTTADGITSIGVFVDFNWTNQDNPSLQDGAWKKTSEVTLYNTYTNVLEMQDYNGSYASTKFGYNQSKVLVNGVMAKYSEIAYSGAEDDPIANKFNNDITLGSAVVYSASSDNIHTGAKSVSLQQGQTGFYYQVPVSKLDASKDYFACVWVKNGTLAPTQAGIYYSVNGGTAVNITQAQYSETMGPWALVRVKIPGSALAAGGNLIVGCFSNQSGTTYFDDFRFQPFNASITSYVYDNTTGQVTHVLDANNVYTKYEYDDLGRLTKVYREAFVKGVAGYSDNIVSQLIKENVYNFGQPQANFTSTAIVNEVFYKQNCAPNLAALPYPVSVAAGQFTSCISKADAENQARQYAQNLANLNGQCASIHGRVELENVYYYNGYSTTIGYADVIVRFYSDAACTIPYTDPVDFSYTKAVFFHSYLDGSQDWQTVDNFSASTNYEYVIGYAIPISTVQFHPISINPETETTETYQLLPGGYQIH